MIHFEGASPSSAAQAKSPKNNAPVNLPGANGTQAGSLLGWPPGPQEPQPGGTNGHNSVSTGGGDDQPVTSHTVPTHHQEDANTEKSDGLQADDMSDDDSESDSDGTIIEDEDNLDDEPVILEGALNASEFEVKGVKQIARKDDDDIGNDEVLKLSQEASALTPIRQNNFVQNNYWELVASAAKK